MLEQILAYPIDIFNILLSLKHKVVLLNTFCSNTYGCPKMVPTAREAQNHLFCHGKLAMASASSQSELTKTGSL